MDRKTKEKVTLKAQTSPQFTLSSLLKKGLMLLVSGWISNLKNYLAGKLDLEKVKFLSVKAKSPQAVRASYDRKAQKFKVKFVVCGMKEMGFQTQSESNATRAAIKEIIP